jgi:hypothetical protein
MTTHVYLSYLVLIIIIVFFIHPCTTKVEPYKARVVVCNRPHREFVILLIEFISCLISAYLILT